MGMLMFPFGVVVLGMIVSFRRGRRRSCTDFRPWADTHLGRRLANFRLRQFGSAEFDTDGANCARLGFDDPRHFATPIGDRPGLAGVGQSINRPLDMLIFFGERSASAIGDFPYPLERQEGRIIVNAELCRSRVVARGAVRIMYHRAALQVSCQTAYTPEMGRALG